MFTSSITTEIRQMFEVIFPRHIANVGGYQSGLIKLNHNTQHI